jgi:hypothetical protein
LPAICALRGSNPRSRIAAGLEQPGLGKMREYPSAELDNVGTLQKPFEQDVSLGFKDSTGFARTDGRIGRRKVAEPIGRI